MLSKSLISSLTDHLLQAVLVIDQKGEGVYCNDSAAQFWQKDPMRILGKQSSALFHGDPLIREKISVQPMIKAEEGQVFISIRNF